MKADQQEVPSAADRFDPGVAHPARVYNYWLGGKDHYEADRAVGDEVARCRPHVVAGARANRAFLARAVRYLAGDCGIRQFLDIGTGLPASGSTHELAQQVAPECAVAYVDNDPLVLVHARALLTSAPGGMTSYIEADVRDTEEILGEAARTLDFGQLIALMMLGIMGQIDDSDEPGSIVSRLLATLPSGSYLALSDGTDTNPEMNQAIAVYNQNSASSYHLRSPEQITAFFAGLDTVPPGVVSTSRWRPDVRDAEEEPREVDSYAGVGRKP